MKYLTFVFLFFFACSPLKETIHIGETGTNKYQRAGYTCESATVIIDGKKTKYAPGRYWISETETGVYLQKVALNEWANARLVPCQEYIFD